ncbi:MAG: M56 family metallopeptidase [Ferruginibacter sp.]
MPQFNFEQAYFLQALGWSIVNSIWQVGILYLLYKAITTGIKCTPVFKYNLGITFLYAGAIGWLYTGINYYFEVQITEPISIQLFKINQLPQFIESLLPYFAIFYCAWLVIHLFKLIQAFKEIIKYKKATLLKAPVELKLFVKNSALSMGIKKSVEIWVSTKVQVPAVIGWLKPLILLPVSATAGLDNEQLEAILIHELAHIKRNDYLHHVLQSIVTTFMYFNPFVHALAASINKEREYCCDDWVLHYQYAPKNYATALFQLETFRLNTIKMAVAATNGKMNLLQRIQRINANNPSTPLQNYRWLFSLTIMVLAFMFLICPSVQNSKFSFNNTSLNTYKPAIGFQLLKPSEYVFSESRKYKVYKPIHFTPIQLQAKKTYRNDFVALAKPTSKNSAQTTPLLKANVGNAIQVGLKNAPQNNLALVKIEEEQSGKEAQRTYYFQLEKEQKAIKVEPLLIFDQPLLTEIELQQKINAIKHHDSSSKPKKKGITT